MSRAYPIIVKPEPAGTITPADIQEWVDSLGERETAMLRTLMERCVYQGASEALADAIDAVCTEQRKAEKGSERQRLLTQVVSGLMQMRLAGLEEARTRGHD